MDIFQQTFNALGLMEEERKDRLKKAGSLE
jgi:hypothetical protein